jgi:peptidyl-Asp metalloendopeptidase
MIIGKTLIAFGLFAAAGSAGANALWQLDASLADASRNALSPAATSAVLVRPQLDLRAQTSFTLAMADGSELRVQRSREELSEQTVSWFGKVLGDADSTVVLTQLRIGKTGHLAGYIQSKHRVYEISPSAQGTVLMEIDDSQFPSCGGAPAPVLEKNHDAFSGTLPKVDEATLIRMPLSKDAPNEIDVLMVFRPGSVTQLGSEAAARTFAQNAVNVSNQAFTNSQMIARFRLAGVSFTTEADVGNASGELNWVRNNAQVASQREAVRADLVSVIAEFSDACGVGYLMNQLGTGFAPSAYQATARSCAIGNLSYPHEHGHNMGLTHDPGNGGNSLFPTYGFGHFVSGNYRTVMSYANNCVGGCTRVAYFSNPNVTYNSAPTGIADQRDNARASNITAPDVANFRTALTAVFANGFE